MVGPPIGRDPVPGGLAARIRRSVRVPTWIALGACLLMVLLLGVLLRGGEPGTGTSGWLSGGGSTASLSPALTSEPTPDASPRPAPSPTLAPSADLAAFLEPDVRDAPPIVLEDQDANPFTLASLRGTQVLVFFGYTHCPDVCPETIGNVGMAMSAFGPGVRALFVTVDPERDTPAWLKEYSQYLPSTFTALTGTANEIRTTADAWGVRYARVDTGVANGYSMSHTADQYLVDATGRLRARFPFGTDPNAITAVLRLVAATTNAPETPAAGSPGPPVTHAPSTLALQPEVVSSSVWAGDHSAVILSLVGPAGRVNDTSAAVTVQLTSADGAAVGEPVAAVAVQPPGLADVSWVATLDIPSPRAWRFSVTARTGALPLTGSTGLVTALEQGATPGIGTTAPAIHTPTLDDVGGVARAVSTDPIPDLRLYARSTTDALADHTPFVLVLDSSKFRVTAACGRALVLAKYLQDRWPQVAFIHHEPFRYSIVTDTPVLDGPLADPPLTDVAAAWGLGSGPWDAISMPWIFVVDGQGIVRAKFQGVVGSEDVDVIVSLIAQGG